MKLTHILLAIQIIFNYVYNCYCGLYNPYCYFGPVNPSSGVLTPEQQQIAKNDWLIRNTLYLTNPYAGNPLLAGFGFKYPPVRVPLYTLKPFGTTRATEGTTSRTTRVTDEGNTDTDSTTSFGGEDEEFRLRV